MMILSHLRPVIVVEVEGLTSPSQAFLNPISEDSNLYILDVLFPGGFPAESVVWCDDGFSIPSDLSLGPMKGNSWSSGFQIRSQDLLNGTALRAQPRRSWKSGKIGWHICRLDFSLFCAV